MPIRFGRVMQPAGVPGSGAANGRRGSNWRKLGSPTFAPMAVRRLSAIASRNDATADRNAFSSYGWQATNPINNFRAHGGVPWTEGTRGRGAGWRCQSRTFSTSCCRDLAGPQVSVAETAMTAITTLEQRSWQGRRQPDASLLVDPRVEPRLRSIGKPDLAIRGRRCSETRVVGERRPPMLEKHPSKVGLDRA